MQIEFEAKFTNIDKDDVRSKLKNIGATLVRPEFLMRRMNFDPPVKINGGGLRVRDEGDKVTLSLKIDAGDKIHDQKESQVVISSFEMGCEILESMGARNKAYQETKREIWKLGEVEFDIDTWPGLNPFLEIEAPNEPTVKAAAEKIGCDWHSALFGGVGRIYQTELGIDIDKINNQTTEITFANPPQKYGS